MVSSVLNNFTNTLKIKITKSHSLYRADLLDLPGTPPVGVGDTPELAVANLFCILISPNKENWLKYIDFVNCKVGLIYE